MTTTENAYTVEGGPLYEHVEQPAPNVIVALCRVMAELPNIGKTMESPQGYLYRGIEQITTHAQPLFARHGVVIAPRRIDWLPTTQLQINNRPWTDEKLIVHYRVYGPGGADDFIDIDVPGIGRDNADKGSNKAMTQAFKYALLQALCIADGKDDADSHDVPQADVTPDAGKLPARPAQLNRIRELTGALRARGTETATTNDEKEVTVLGVQLLERRDDGKLYACVTDADAADLIGALSARLADVLLEAPAESPPTEPETAQAPAHEPAVQEPEAPAERAMTDRERKAREQLAAVNPPKADKS